MEDDHKILKLVGSFSNADSLQSFCCEDKMGYLLFRWWILVSFIYLHIDILGLRGKYLTQPHLLNKGCFCFHTKPLVSLGRRTK